MLLFFFSSFVVSFCKGSVQYFLVSAWLCCRSEAEPSPTSNCYQRQCKAFERRAASLWVNALCEPNNAHCGNELTSMSRVQTTTEIKLCVHFRHTTVDLSKHSGTFTVTARRSTEAQSIVFRRDADPPRGRSWRTLAHNSVVPWSGCWFEHENRSDCLMWRLNSDWFAFGSAHNSLCAQCTHPHKVSSSACVPCCEETDPCSVLCLEGDRNLKFNRGFNEFYHWRDRRSWKVSLELKSGPSRQWATGPRLFNLHILVAFSALFISLPFSQEASRVSH